MFTLLVAALLVRTRLLQSVPLTLTMLSAWNQSALHTYCSKLVHIHNSKMWLIVACICDFLMLQCTALGKSSKCVRRLEFYPFSEVSHSRYLNRLTTHLKMFTKKNRRRCVRQIITGKGYFSLFYMHLLFFLVTVTIILVLLFLCSFSGLWGLLSLCLFMWQ